MRFMKDDVKGCITVVETEKEKQNRYFDLQGSGYPGSQGLNF